MDKDKVYLEEIRDFCNKIIAFTSGVSYEDFLKDEKLQLAVLKLIENVGEAAKRLSAGARKQHPQADWRKAMAMRDRLVHDYMDVDLVIVYDVAANEIEKFLRNLE